MLLRIECSATHNYQPIAAMPLPHSAQDLLRNRPANRAWSFPVAPAPVASMDRKAPHNPATNPGIYLPACAILHRLLSLSWRTIDTRAGIPGR